jgi:hypothetical protein
MAFEANDDDDDYMIKASHQYSIDNKKSSF